MTTLTIHPPRHLHSCTECGRGFYVCSERDCSLAPEVCQGCEMDRQDAYFSTLETKDTHHADHR